ncbi:octaprenyl-diphosphate synthase [Campylobacter avium LMG 24591]|uniref:Octaprenyl-diphosphate synthase n=1 Tax=Campylobacter avium LMG 24591 TaxID=522484 RepID=A0A222MXS6_9BACT|nr:polyprenyl synthetase family protein [Campylobacter avium]ASQ30783.1 octaprenyl-diphosphate synthase [Campylobacter avium LMG 24591]OYD78595.1 octaprenyl-diphosphate synthase [Campylobacter avium]
MQEIDTLIQNFLKDLGNDIVLRMSNSIKTGKKLRSKLILSISGENESSYRLCAVVELIHLASLLHDDIVDEASLRRGARSVNAEFGAKNALMLGDVFYSKAFYELLSLDKKIASIVANAVSKLAIGELLDVELSKSFNADKNLYLDMLYKKTAVLIEASAASAAILAGFDENDFKEYGKNLGIAFQLVDDILDVQGDEKTLGKEAFSDFKEGKSTLPYIYLYEALADKSLLLNFYKKELNGAKKDELLKLFARYEILQKCKNEALAYGQRALQAIQSYDNQKLNDIVENMIDRSF